MHTWFFLYDEALRAEVEAELTQHHNLNYNSHAHTPKSRGGVADMSASVSVPNLDQSDINPPGNVAYFPGHPGHFGAPPPPVAPPSAAHNHRHNFMMYGHAQSVHAAAPPSPPGMMEHGHAHHHHCSGGLNQHHSRSVPSVAAAVASAASAAASANSQASCGDPYASRTSLNHEVAGSSSRPQSRSHSHFCQQQGCDYPSG